jgi:hypothetical protein
MMTGISGCVVYDETLIEDTAAAGLDRPGDRPDGQSGEDLPGAIWLHPAGAAPGETAIVALVSAGGRDLREITELTFYGETEDVVVLADSPRSADEHLLTLQVMPDVGTFEVHLLVEFADGTEEFISDAFIVEAEPSLIPQTPAPPTCD